MAQLLDLQGRVYYEAKAVEVAEQLNAGEDDGFVYTVEAKGGYARVAAHDKDGTFVGHF